MAGREEQKPTCGGGLAFPLFSETPGTTFSPLAVERGLDPVPIGRLFGEGWQRLVFDRGAAGLEVFAAVATPRAVTYACATRTVPGTSSGPGPGCTLRSVA
jgi:hypothetical protein